MTATPGEDEAMQEDESEYVLGTDDAELARLGFQHQVWAQATAASWERGGFHRGATILDVGCGPGYATFDLAHLVGPDGRVIAVDVSQRFVSFVQREAARRELPQVQARVEELSVLSQPASSVDGAFARWVMCFLPDPATVIAHVARALRPGASFVMLDYVHYEGFHFAPESAASQRVFAAVAESFRAHGGNPNVGLDLPGHAIAAGLEVAQVRPHIRIGRPGTALWDWPSTFFRNYLPTLVESGGLTSAEVTAFWADYYARSTNPAAFFLSPPMVEVIAVKPVA